eukprot:6232139-Prorocentrum_lima.AAC.1
MSIFGATSLTSGRVMPDAVETFTKPSYPSDLAVSRHLPLPSKQNTFSRPARSFARTSLLMVCARC